MLGFYDLHDLHRVFVNIRFVPDYELNDEILVKVIGVLKYGEPEIEDNRLRTALSAIPGLDKKLYAFVFVQNIYSFSPRTFLGGEETYNVLIESCECLLKAFNDKNYKQVDDLADCLHNLPLHITENKYSIPKEFWKNEVKYYRKKWDKSFLENFKQEKVNN